MIGRAQPVDCICWWWSAGCHTGEERCGFPAVAFHVTIHVERENPIWRPKACASVTFYTCRSGIVRDNHPGRAEGLDPLIVSKNSPTRIEDHSLLAGLRDHGHASCVDITQFADLGCNEAAAPTVNTDRLFA